jgi:uncharacterized membrane protein YhhN
MLILLVPYLLLVLVYIFGFGVHRSTPPPGTLVSAVFKCLPIAYLLFLMVIAPKIDPEHNSYRYAIAAGYVFSMGGDWCLNWPKTLFLPGLGLFAVTQLCYTWGFGSSPFGGQTLFMFVLAAMFTLKVLVPGIKERSLSIAVIFYISLLGLMGWRATARHKEHRQWDTWMAMAGAVIFIVSDFTIAFNRWNMKVPRAILIIMVTYYIAQMLLAISVLVPVYQAISRIRFMGM